MVSKRQQSRSTILLFLIVIITVNCKIFEYGDEGNEDPTHYLVRQINQEYNNPNRKFVYVDTTNSRKPVVETFNNYMGLENKQNVDNLMSMYFKDNAPTTNYLDEGGSYNQGLSNEDYGYSQSQQQNGYGRTDIGLEPNPSPQGTSMQEVYDYFTTPQQKGDVELKLTPGQKKLLNSPLYFRYQKYKEQLREQQKQMEGNSASEREGGVDHTLKMNVEYPSPRFDLDEFVHSNSNSNNNNNNNHVNAVPTSKKDDNTEEEFGLKPTAILTLQRNSDKARQTGKVEKIGENQKKSSSNVEEILENNNEEIENTNRMETSENLKEEGGESSSLSEKIIHDAKPYAAKVMLLSNGTEIDVTAKKEDQQGSNFNNSSYSLEESQANKITEQMYIGENNTGVIEKNAQIGEVEINAEKSSQMYHKNNSMLGTIQKINASLYEPNVEEGEKEEISEEENNMHSDDPTPVDDNITNSTANATNTATETESESKQKIPLTTNNSSEAMINNNTKTATGDSKSKTAVVSDADNATSLTSTSSKSGELSLNSQESNVEDEKAFNNETSSNDSDLTSDDIKIDDSVARDEEKAFNNDTVGTENEMSPDAENPNENGESASLESSTSTLKHDDEKAFKNETDTFPDKYHIPPSIGSAEFYSDEEENPPDMGDSEKNGGGSSENKKPNVREKTVFDVKNSTDLGSEDVKLSGSDNETTASSEGSANNTTQIETIDTTQNSNSSAISETNEHKQKEGSPETNQQITKNYQSNSPDSDGDSKAPEDPNDVDDFGSREESGNSEEEEEETPNNADTANSKDTEKENNNHEEKSEKEKTGKTPGDEIDSTSNTTEANTEKSGSAIEESGSEKTEQDNKTTNEKKFSNSNNEDKNKYKETEKEVSREVESSDGEKETIDEKKDKSDHENSPTKKHVTGKIGRNHGREGAMQIKTSHNHKQSLEDSKSSTETTSETRENVNIAAIGKYSRHHHKLEHGYKANNVLSGKENSIKKDSSGISMKSEKERGDREEESFEDKVWKKMTKRKKENEKLAENSKHQEKTDKKIEMSESLHHDKSHGVRQSKTDSFHGKIIDNGDESTKSYKDANDVDSNDVDPNDVDPNDSDTENTSNKLEDTSRMHKKNENNPKQEEYNEFKEEDNYDVGEGDTSKEGTEKSYMGEKNIEQDQKSRETTQEFQGNSDEGQNRRSKNKNKKNDKNFEDGNSTDGKYGEIQDPEKLYKALMHGKKVEEGNEKNNATRLSPSPESYHDDNADVVTKESEQHNQNNPDNENDKTNNHGVTESQENTTVSEKEGNGNTPRKEQSQKMQTHPVLISDNIVTDKAKSRELLNEDQGLEAANETMIDIIEDPQPGHGQENPDENGKESSQFSDTSQADLEGKLIKDEEEVMLENEKQFKLERTKEHWISEQQQRQNPAQNELSRINKIENNLEADEEEGMLRAEHEQDRTMFATEETQPNQEKSLATKETYIQRGEQSSNKIYRPTVDSRSTTERAKKKDTHLNNRDEEENMLLEEQRQYTETTNAAGNIGDMKRNENTPKKAQTESKLTENREIDKHRKTTSPHANLNEDLLKNQDTVHFLEEPNTEQITKENTKKIINKIVTDIPEQRNNENLENEDREDPNLKKEENNGGDQETQEGKERQNTPNIGASSSEKEGHITANVGGTAEQEEEERKSNAQKIKVKEKKMNYADTNAQNDEDEESRLLMEEARHNQQQQKQQDDREKNSHETHEQEENDNEERLLEEERLNEMGKEKTEHESESLNDKKEKSSPNEEMSDSDADNGSEAMMVKQKHMEDSSSTGDNSPKTPQSNEKTQTLYDKKSDEHKSDREKNKVSSGLDKPFEYLEVAKKHIADHQAKGEDQQDTRGKMVIDESNIKSFTEQNYNIDEGRAKKKLFLDRKKAELLKADEEYNSIQRKTASDQTGTLKRISALTDWLSKASKLLKTEHVEQITEQEKDEKAFKRRRHTVPKRISIKNPRRNVKKKQRINGNKVTPRRKMSAINYSKRFWKDANYDRKYPEYLGGNNVKLTKQPLMYTRQQQRAQSPKQSHNKHQYDDAARMTRSKTRLPLDITNFYRGSQRQYNQYDNYNTN